MKFSLDFISRISSRKFIVFLTAIVLFLIRPQHFTGDHVVIVFAVFIGGNVLEKFIGKKNGTH